MNDNDRVIRLLQIAGGHPALKQECCAAIHSIVIAWYEQEARHPNV